MLEIQKRQSVCVCKGDGETKHKEYKEKRKSKRLVQYVPGCEDCGQSATGQWPHARDEMSAVML